MSMIVKCPNCGTEFEPVKGEMKHETTVMHIDGVGYLVPKEIHNDNVPRDEHGRFVKRETTIEYGKETTTNTENKENKAMNSMNGFDMEALAKMVAERMKNEMKEVAKNVVSNETRVSNGTVDGGMWAKTSKFYGKEICGFAYNPYLIRRFLPAQFMSMMNENGWNVDSGIRKRYNYIDAMIYLKKECNTLAMLQKRDKIAFEERREFWSERDIATVFEVYLNDVKKYIRRRVNNSHGKNFCIKSIGCIEVTSKEVVRKHKAVYEYSFDESKVFEKIDILINDLKNCRTYKQIADKLNAFKLIKIPGSIRKEWTYDYNLRRGRYIHRYNPNGYILPKLFINNFKKAGAYYTLKNFIMFDNVKFEDTYGREAVLKLRNYLYSIPDYESYKFYAKLKDVVRENNINLARFSNQ